MHPIFRWLPIIGAEVGHEHEENWEEMKNISRNDIVNGFLESFIENPSIFTDVVAGIIHGLQHPAFAEDDAKRLLRTWWNLLNDIDTN
jgi:hypothetical protein